MDSSHKNKNKKEKRKKKRKKEKRKKKNININGQYMACKLQLWFGVNLIQMTNVYMLSNDSRGNVLSVPMFMEVMLGVFLRLQ